MSDESTIRQNIKSIETGSNIPKYVTVTYPFEIYEIVVKLTIDGKFVGIEEVKINKDFRNYKNKTGQTIFSEINELPKDIQPE